MDASYYKNHLNLVPHPEGGFFKEVYRSSELIKKRGLPDRFPGDRSIATSIYYLLEKGDYSGFHRIKGDECWHFYAGGSLLVHVIEPGGRYYKIKLGSLLDKGEVFQYVVHAGAWFASEPAEETDFSLVGCTVAPGFDFEDFEMADKESLRKEYSEHRNVISRLCR